MASKLSFLTLFMEKKKPLKDNNNNNNNNNTTINEFVKAAAWAWFQHNSGSKGKTITEFDATVTRRTPKPSRYKLEAIRMAREEAQGSPIHTKKLSLLDEYEVQSISRKLNNLVESSSSNNNSLNNKVVSGADKSTNRRVRKNKVKKLGFWLRHGAVCGREGDVVDTIALKVGRSAKQQ